MKYIILIGCSVVALIIPYITEATNIEMAALQIAYLVTGWGIWRTFS